MECHRNGARLAVPSGSVLAEVLYVGDEFEREEVARVRRRVRRGWRALGIGANNGFYPILLGKTVRQNGRAGSLEPFVPVAGYLRSNVERNGVTNIDVIESATADVAGVLELPVFGNGGDVYKPLGVSRGGARV